MRTKKTTRTLSVWFFVAAILIVYGVMLMVNGALIWLHGAPTVNFKLHPCLWWGLLIALTGGLFLKASFVKT